MLRAERLGADLFVVVHGHAPPSDLEWDPFCELMSRAPVRAVFVLSAGGGPNATQRKRLLAVCERQAEVPRVAVLSASGLVRTIAAAFCLFSSMPVELHPPHELDAALDHLGIRGSDREAVLEASVRLARELGLRIDSLDSVAPSPRSPGLA